MSSRIINKYHELRKEDKTKVYLFKTGYKYIAIDEDAYVLNGLLKFNLIDNNGLKQCNILYDNIKICKEMLEHKHIKYQVITECDLALNYNSRELLEYITNIDLKNITLNKCIEELEYLKENVRYISN